MLGEEIKIWFINNKAEHIIDEFSKRFDIERNTLAVDLEDVLDEQVANGNAARITDLKQCEHYREMGWKMINLYPQEALPILNEVLKLKKLKTDSM